jgi:DNA-binding CsgD family transcriptional regulator/tetratricopeptide (TPR) repeat protein
MRLLERDHLLEPLRALALRAEAGQGAFVFIGGEAGVGKTSLVRAFVDDLPAGRPALWGVCDALQTPSALSAFNDMVAQLDAPTRSRLQGLAQRADMFAAFRDAVALRGGVLVFEDVHWADEATLDLLRHLARRVGRMPLLVLATYRDDGAGPSQPLRMLFGDLATAGTHRLSIAPLSLAGVGTLVGDARIDAADLRQRTGGNPFFVTEVLASPAQTIPATVRDAVLARVLRASAPCREALEVVAVVPGRAERWLVEAVLPGSEATLERCHAEGLLTREHGSVRFRHEIARQVVEEWLPPALSINLHTRVLRELEARAGDAWARLVHHATRAGAVEASARYALLAAQQAARAGAHREAASHYAQALSSGALTDAATHAGCLEARSYEHYLVGEIEAAIACRIAALQIWQQHPQVAAQGRNLCWLSRLHWMLGDRKQAELYGAQAVERLQAAPPDRELAMAYSNLSQLAMLAENASDATRWGERAIALAEVCRAQDILVHALNNVGHAKARADDATGPPLLDRSLRLALEHGLEEHAARAYCNLASGAIIQRDYARAEAQLDAGMAYSLDRGLETWSVYLTACRSRCRFDQGHWDAATRDADEVLGRTGLGAIWRIPALTVVAALRMRRGDPGSVEMLDEVLRLTAPTGELQRIWPVAVARAEAAWLAGDLRRCRDEAAVGFALARAGRCRWASGETAFWLWRSGALVEWPMHCAEPYALQMRGDWRAAAAAWADLGCPYEQASALIDGDAVAQRRALRIYEDLGARAAALHLRHAMRAQGQRGVPRGPRATTLGNAFGLTTRELEVLHLLEQGLSNARIADQVHRSVRTVDHHVAAILAKLRAGSRSEAIQRARHCGVVAPTAARPLAT